MDYLFSSSSPPRRRRRDRRAHPGCGAAAIAELDVSPPARPRRPPQAPRQRDLDQVAAAIAERSTSSTSATQREQVAAGSPPPRCVRDLDQVAAGAAPASAADMCQASSSSWFLDGS